MTHARRFGHGDGADLLAEFLGMRFSLLRRDSLSWQADWPWALPSSCSEHRQEGYRGSHYLGTMKVKHHGRWNRRLEKEPESLMISFTLVMLFPGHQIYLRNKMLLPILCWWAFVKFSLNWINWLQNFWGCENQLIVSVAMLTRTKYKISAWLCVVWTVEIKARQCRIH